MHQFKLGEKVRIQADIGPGAFSSEYTVTFEAADGPVSGFVRKEHITLDDAHQGIGYLEGTVTGVEPEIIMVRVQGSFFRTTGIAALKREWANEHVRVAHAA
jgi:hypothetical protein